MKQAYISKNKNGWLLEFRDKTRIYPEHDEAIKEALILGAGEIEVQYTPFQKRVWTKEAIKNLMKIEA